MVLVTEGRDSSVGCGGGTTGGCGGGEGGAGEAGVVGGGGDGEVVGGGGRGEGAEEEGPVVKLTNRGRLTPEGLCAVMLQLQVAQGVGSMQAGCQGSCRWHRVGAVCRQGGRV